MVENLEQLKNRIREWVKMDNEIRALNKELANRRAEKKSISEELIVVMRENKYDEFDIKDGQILYVKKNVKKPISQKQLLTVLSNYYGDTEEAEKVNTYILDNREEVVRETIKRKIN